MRVMTVDSCRSVWISGFLRGPGEHGWSRRGRGLLSGGGQGKGEDPEGKITFELWGNHGGTPLGVGMWGWLIRLSGGVALGF